MPTATGSVAMPYRRCGGSGLLLPAISLGLWQGMGSYRDESVARDIILRAFARGVTHFDLANNYGTPAGASESLFGRILKDLPREQIVVSTKAGHRMWPGPYGDGGGRKYLIQSCEQSLRRLGLDQVDLFYSHRPDPETDLEETLGALDHLVRQGKALYAGLSNYPDPRLTRALDIVQHRGFAPITLHQPRYSLLDRRAEREVLPTTGPRGVGVIAFSPLEQGILAGRYRNGLPPDSRAVQNQGNGGLTRETLEKNAAKIEAARRLEPIAARRGQTLAQLSIAWLLKDPRVTSVLIGASSVAQLDENLDAVANLAFTADELKEIDQACGVG